MTPIVLTDAEIDRRANTYAAQRVSQRTGMTFERYLLCAPHARLESDLEASGCVVRNGHWIEKLRHHVWPRKADRKHQTATRRSAASA